MANCSRKQKILILLMVAQIVLFASYNVGVSRMEDVNRIQLDFRLQEDTETHQLGKYDWNQFSEDDLQRLDEEGTKYMEEYRERCQSQKQFNDVLNLDKGVAESDLCPCVPPNLQGQLVVNYSIPTWPEVKAAIPLVAEGGTYKPTDCRARQKVAVIIPYRDRVAPLKVFLRHLHPILQRQQAHYVVYVVDQLPGSIFNRAFLMNVGFAEARRTFGADCYIFHDVDLMTEDDRLLYRCQKYQPTHLSEFVDRYKYRVPYANQSGGALAIHGSLFEKINGYSNLFWGWGKEDDEIFWRFHDIGVKFFKPPKSVGRFHTVKHEREKENTMNAFNADIKSQTKDEVVANITEKRYLQDGLSSLKYKVEKTVHRQLFTHIYVKPDIALMDFVPFPNMAACSITRYYVTSASLTDCATLCKQQSACAGFVYDMESRSKQCELKSAECFDSQKASTSISHIFYVKTNPPKTKSNSVLDYIFKWANGATFFGRKGQ